MNPQAGATAQSMVPMFDRNAGMGMGLPSDVVSLAMTYTEAVSAEISAASEFARVEPLQKKGYINEAQLREVEAKLQLARRKVQLLRTIIPILTETADVERSVIRKRLEEIQKREEEGSPLSEDRNAEIELQLREFQTQARLQILQELQKQIKESSAKADPEERPAGSKEPANSSN